MVVLYAGLGWLLLAMAVAAIVHDGLAWWADGSFHLLGLGDLWSHLDIRSLSDAQNAVQRHVSTAMWNWIVRPILMIPALPAFLVLGLAISVARQSERRRRRCRLRDRSAAAAAPTQPRALLSLSPPLERERGSSNARTASALQHGVLIFTNLH